MWQLLGSVISGFLLLRDLFGYLIPGVIFSAIVVGRTGMSLPAEPWSKAPLWLVIVLAVGSCYVVGHILVAIGYTLHAWFDPIYWRLPPVLRWKHRRQPANAADLLHYRYLYPSLFIERDRRDTIHILRVGVSIALIAGCWLLPAGPLWLPLDLRLIVLVIGLFMFFNGHGGEKHLIDMGHATLAAAQRTERKRVPYFQWNRS